MMVMVTTMVVVTENVMKVRMTINRTEVMWSKRLMVVIMIAMFSISVPLQARKKDAVMRQGNALALVPFMRDAANKTLIVHAGGHVLDSIYMSILEHPEPLEERVKEEDHMDGDDDHKPPPGGGGASRYDWPCSMSGSRVARLGMSTIQQICRVPTESQDEDDRGGYPLQFMARAGCEAQLFAIDSQKRIGMPDNIRFSVMPKYKLQVRVRGR